MQLSYLNRDNLREFLERFFRMQMVEGAMFSSLCVLDTYLNKIVNRLYQLEVDGEYFLISKRVFRKEYRFLFKAPSQDILEEFIKIFEPSYVSAHFLSTTDVGEKLKTEKEIISSTDFEDLSADIKRKYKKSLDANGSLVVEKFNYQQRLVDLTVFLEEWRNSRGEEKDIWARIENDLNLLVSYGSQHALEGIVIKDSSKNKIVAYNLYCPSAKKGMCLSICSKVLRGYKQLGVFLKIESFKMMKESGFDRVNLGQVNNYFKKSFDSDLSMQMYHKEIFIAEKFKETILDRDKFLMMYF